MAGERLDQEAARAMVHSIIEEHKHSLVVSEREKFLERVQYISKVLEEIMTNENPSSSVPPKIQVEEIIKAQCVDLLKVSPSPFTDLEIKNEQEADTKVKEMNVFLRELNYFKNSVVKAVKELQDREDTFKKSNAEITTVATKLLKRAKKAIEQSVLPDAVNRISLQDIKDALLQLTQAGSALVASGKSWKRADQMMGLQHWLKEQFTRLDVIDDQLEHYHTLVAQQRVAKTSEERLGEFSRKIVAPDGTVAMKNRIVSVNDLSLVEYRKKMEEVFTFDDSFRKLTEGEQKRLLLDLELRHLENLRSQAASDVETRICVEMQEANDKKKDAVKRAVDSYASGDDALKRKFYDAIDHPKTHTPEQVERNEEIKRELARIASEKRKKMIGRAFMFIAAGFAVAYVAATIAAAAPLAMALIGAGVVAGFVIAKIINPDDSIDKIAKKGFLYFKDKIRGVKTSEQRAEEKYGLATAGQHEDMQTRMKKAMTKQVFTRYKEMTKKNDKATTAHEDTAKLLEIEGKEQAEADVIKRLTRRTGHITDTPRIAESKKNVAVAKIVSALQRAERQVADIADNVVPVSQITTTANDFAEAVRATASDPQLKEAAALFGKVSVLKFKKNCERTLAMVASVTASCIKSVRAGNEMKLDYWLKRRLIDRAQLQMEISNISRETIVKEKVKVKVKVKEGDSDVVKEIEKEKIPLVQDPDFERKIQEKYDQLFPDARDRKFNQLSSNKFLSKLEEVIWKDQEFLAMSDAEQSKLIANLHLHHKLNAMDQLEDDMVVRAKVEMSSPRDRKKYESLIEHLNKEYLGYAKEKGGFKERLNIAMTGKGGEVFRDTEHQEACIKQNEAIKQEIKDKVNERRRKVVSRVFLLIFAGLTLASLVAGFATAGPAVIAGLLVGALAAAIVAKAINKDESMKEIVSKGLGNLTHKVRKQFSLWSVKEHMKEQPEVKQPGVKQAEAAAKPRLDDAKPEGREDVPEVPKLR